MSVIDRFIWPSMILVTSCLAICGCEHSLTFEATPAKVTGTEFDGPRRGGYDWEVTAQGFPIKRPSDFTYFEEVKPAVERWASSFNPHQSLPPLSDIEGLDERAMRRFRRLAEKPQGLKLTCTIPVTVKPGKTGYAISQDGSKVATCENDSLVVWNAESGAMIKTHTGILPELRLIAFAPSGNHAFVTGGRQIAYVELDTGKTLARTDQLSAPIEQWHVASQVGTVVAKLVGGKIAIFEQRLDELTLLSDVNVVGEVSIDPKGSCLACWNGNTPLQVALQGVHTGAQEIPPNVIANTGFQGVCQSEGVTRWFLDHSQFAWTHQEFGKPIDQRQREQVNLLWRVDGCWCGDDNYVLVRAIRVGADGKKEPFVFEAWDAFFHSMVPQPLPEDSIDLVPNLSLEKLLTVFPNELRIYHRQLFQIANINTFLNQANRMLATEQFDALDIIGGEILKEERFWRFGMPAQEVYSQYSIELAKMAARIELDPAQKELAAKLENWYARQSPLSRIVRIHKRIIVGWEARGSGYASTVTDEGWKVLSREVDKAHEELQPMMAEDPPRSAVFEALVDDYRNRSVDALELQPHLKRLVEAHPSTWEPHVTLMGTLLPRWGGHQGDGHAYAVGLASIYPEDYGHYIYAKLMIRNQYYFMNHQQLYTEMGAEATRVHKGLLAAIELPGVQQGFLEAGIDMIQGIVRPGEITPLLEYYYQRYPVAQSNAQSNTNFHSLINAFAREREAKAK